MYVLECNPVKLAFVDVGDTVVFASLGTAARCLQVVFKSIGGKPGCKNITREIFICNPVQPVCG